MAVLIVLAPVLAAVLVVLIFLTSRVACEVAQEIGIGSIW